MVIVMKNNNAGFTLVELLVTIILLALVAGIGAYSITAIMERSKEENYNILIKNIQSAAETYYQECKYSNNDSISCTSYDSGYKISLGNLVTYGYLKGNTKKNDNTYTIENPLNNQSIADCEIIVKYENGKVTVTNNSGNNCPNFEDSNNNVVDDNITTDEKIATSDSVTTN